MTIKIHVVYPLMASFLLAGCSQGPPGTSAPRAAPMPSASASPTPSASASPTLIGATLLETCPKYESALADLSPSWKGAEWAAARQEMQTISDAGDLETQSALIVLLATLETLESEPEGLAWLDAEEARDNALTNLNKRCRDVGYSAPQ